MIIGVPKEIKNNENRVGMTPAGVDILVKNGHTILVQKTAGEGSGLSDESYQKAGATILPTIEEIYQKSEMIVKVKEPIKEEYPLIKKDQIIFTYFHFASSQELTEAMLKQGAVCIAYETVQKTDNSLPLLIPMSEIAGRMSIQEGAKYLEKPMGGRGILLGGIPGVSPAKVVILGAGVVGTQAAKMAAGLGADVSLLDISLPRLRALDDILPYHVKKVYADHYTIHEVVKNADLIVGSVLVVGDKTPNLVTRAMLKTMKKHSVMVDVAIDQGGCFETSKATTHENPTFVVDDILHYCVANMPGAVPYTSTLGLTNATLFYVKLLANKGWKTACKEYLDLQKGINIVHGKIYYQGVANAFNMPCKKVESILS